MGFWVFFKVAPSLLIFNTDIFLVTFIWIKEKANAKGNGDWHLRNSRFCKKVMSGFFSFTIWACFTLVPWFFLFFCSCMWREESKHAVGFFFSTSCRQSATKRTCVFFIADRSVKRSVLVCWLFRRQSKKKERTEVRSFRVWGYNELSSRFFNRSRSATRCW